jgi:CubicO group peptidase (beta-lactamase class C family)
MTANHVGTLYNDGNMGFGLGFEVIEHLGRTGRFGSVGTYGWGSAYFQRFFVDPQEKLVAVFYAQLIPAGGLDIQEKWRDWMSRRDRAAATGACRRAASALRKRGGRSDLGIRDSGRESCQ